MIAATFPLAAGIRMALPCSARRILQRLHDVGFLQCWIYDWILAGNRRGRDGGGWQYEARSREARKSLVDMKRYRRLGNRQQGRPWRVTAYSWRSVSTTTCCLYMERFIARNRSLKGTARRQRSLVRMSLIQALFRSSWFSSASEMRVWPLLWLRSLGMANDISTSRVPLSSLLLGDFFAPDYLSLPGHSFAIPSLLPMYV